MSVAPALLVLGCGFTGTAVARRALEAGRAVSASVRSEAAAAPLRALGIDARALPKLDTAVVLSLMQAAKARALAGGERGNGSSLGRPSGNDSNEARVDVVVTFPPDEATDAAVTAALSAARRIVYISSTAVYGDTRGRIDEATPVDGSSPRARARLAAEARYRACRAVVLRAAGIYGVGRGLHRRILDGTFRMPGEANHVVSRIHVDDLAAFVLGALSRGQPGGVYVVADDTPVPQREAIAWLCDRLGRPLPPSVPPSELDETLRHDRSVDNAAAKRALGVTLAFPGYREGFLACLAAEGTGAEGTGVEGTGTEGIDRSIDGLPKAG